MDLTIQCFSSNLLSESNCPSIFLLTNTLMFLSDLRFQTEPSRSFWHTGKYQFAILVFYLQWETDSQRQNIGCHSSQIDLRFKSERLEKDW